MSIQLAVRDAATERKGCMATVVFAGLVGTIIEWYDFFIYGTAAALVFNTLFFPNIGPLAGTSGASVGFQLSAALGGGFSPIIATALAGYMGGTAGVSMMLILSAAITFIVPCSRKKRRAKPSLRVLESVCHRSRSHRATTATNVRRRGQSLP
jgi:MFS family permease